jgi:DNA-binding transcriptional ArsR family regulator
MPSWSVRLSPAVGRPEEELDGGIEGGVIFNPMVEYRSSLDDTYAALADPTRRAILARLRGRPARVTELAAPFPMSLAAVSKHIRVLEEAGLVHRRIQGRDHVLSLDPAPLRRASDWIEPFRDFWSRRLDALDAYLRRRQAGKKEP